jgi:hypothetical protein
MKTSNLSIVTLAYALFVAALIQSLEKTVIRHCQPIKNLQWLTIWPLTCQLSATFMKF